MKKTLIPFLVISLIGNIFLLYVLLDNAITIDHSTSQMVIQSENTQTAAKVTTKIIGKTSKEEIEQLIKTSFKDKIVKWDGDILYINEIGLRFKNDKLIEMVELNKH